MNELAFTSMSVGEAAKESQMNDATQVQVSQPSQELEELLRKMIFTRLRRGWPRKEESRHYLR